MMGRLVLTMSGNLVQSLWNLPFSVLLNFTICVSFLFKEIAILTPTSASGGMTYCSASHGRSKAMILQVRVLDQVPIIQQVTSGDTLM